jgi:nucleotide-binding universal stress UspA family protein
MYTRILVPVDGSPTATAGLREAIRLAGKSGVTIRLIHVVDRLSLVQAMEPTPLIEDMMKSMEVTGRAALEESRALVEKAGIAAQVALKKPAAGSVADAIVKEARQWKAGLIVMGTHGRRGISRMIMGSAAQGVVASSTIPILLVRGPAGLKRR